FSWKLTVIVTMMGLMVIENPQLVDANLWVLWIQNQMLDYRFNFMNTKIFIDNQSTICIVKNLVFHQRTKHIEIRHHFIRDANEKNLIQVIKIHTDKNVADLLTKAFDGPRFHYLVYVYILTNSCSFSLVYCRMNAVSCGVLLYSVQIVSSHPMMLVVPVFLLVILVHADGLVPAGSCTIPIGPSEIIATIDGNEVVVTESLIKTQLQLNDETGLYEFTLNDVLDGMREIAYPTDGSLTFYKARLSPQWRFLIQTLIHCMSPKSGGWNQFPSFIASALICMSTGWTYNFSRFILDGMIGNIESKRHKFLMYPRFLQMILGIQTTDPSPRPTFDFTTKLFSNMKLNWDGPYMPLLPPMLVVPAGGDGADAAAAGASAANKVLPPPPPLVTPPPDVLPTHTSSSTPGPSTAAQDKPVRDLTPTTPFNTTTSTRPPSPTRKTSFLEDISKGGGYVSSPKSNEASQTTAATAAGGVEDSVALTDLSLKLDRYINRVTTLENELGVTKKVLGGVVLKLVSRVKWLEGILTQRKRRMVLSDSEGDEAATKEQEINLAALHELASTSLGDNTTIEAAFTISKASQNAHASLYAGHDEDEVPNTTTLPFRRTRTNRRRLRKTFTSSAVEHFQENIFAVEDAI
nr:putative ribonuclease H-like domain-containing protein [Tanacetum cinerariifolium]